MTWSEITVVVVTVLVLIVWWVWITANRIDRLHRKVAASRAVVDTQLLRRASAASTLSASGLLDPVSSVLIGEAAWASISAGRTDTGGIAPLPAGIAAPAPEADRGWLESELSATLREVLDDPAEIAELRDEPGGAELLDALADAWYRVQLARRFHNEAVAQAQRMRRGWAVRTFRLAGRAPMPQTLELDDAWPTALGAAGAPPESSSV